MVNFEDVKHITIEEFFSGNQFAINTFRDKYSQTVGDRKETPAEVFWRVSREIASVEATEEKKKYWAERWFDELWDDWWRPGGSIISGAGSTSKISTSNCTTTAIRGDSLEEIFGAAYRLAKDCAFRQGIGVDFSKLRPRGMKINNSAKVSSGAIHWMKFFDGIANYVGQEGRIPALLLSLKVDHPDIEEFIKAKSDLHSIQNANVSVQITDAFMEAVLADKEWELSFVAETGEKFTKSVNARQLMRLLSERACNFAEPGIQFIDMMQRWQNTSYVKDPKTGQFMKPVSSNACSLHKDTLMRLESDDPEKSCYATMDWMAEHNDGYHKMWNPITGKFHMCHVYQSGISSSFVELKYSLSPIFPVDEDGTDIWTVICTDNHKFMTEDGREVEAKDLEGVVVKVDHHKLSSTKILSVTKLDLVDEPVYDFTMPDGVPPWGEANYLYTHNSEKPMYPDSVCVLGSINVERFSIYREEYIKELGKIGESITRFLDNVVTYELNSNRIPIPEQRHVMTMLREIGCGMTNLQGWFLKMGVAYDSVEAVEAIDDFTSVYTAVCYGTSCDLGAEKGSFEAFSHSFYESPFVKRLGTKYPDMLTRFTMRNSMLMSIAPTGTLSLTFRKPAMSTGIEPVPGFYYWKRSRTSGQWKWYFCIPEAVRQFLKERGLMCDMDSETVEDPDGKIGEAIISGMKASLVNFDVLFRPAHLLDPFMKVELMSRVGQWIDSSISTTYNLPESASPALVEQIYIEAWKKGVKSVAVYRDKCRQGVIEFDPPPVVEKRFGKNAETSRPDKVERRCAPKRPKELPCEINHITVNGKKWVVLVGIYNNEPFEVFAGHSDEINIPSKLKSGKIVKNPGSKYSLVIPMDDEVLEFKDMGKLFHNDEQNALTRQISLNMRTGTHLQFIVEQLKKGAGSVADFSAAIARVLGKFSRDVVDRAQALKCPSCGSDLLDRSAGCIKCTECGWSRCE